MRTLKIGEVAAQADVAVDTIRYYERRGVLRPLGRRRSGYREYDPKTVRRVQTVKSLQGMGFNLDEVIAILGDLDAGRATCANQRGRVGEVLSRIEERIADLEQVRSHLTSTVERCGRGHCALVDLPRPERPRLSSSRFRG